MWISQQSLCLRGIDDVRAHLERGVCGFEAERSGMFNLYNLISFSSANAFIYDTLQGGVQRIVTAICFFFTGAFSLPFILMPLIFCLSFWNFVIPVVGYAVPVYLMMLVICSPSANEIFQWLKGMGLVRYYALLQLHGYRSMADLTTITAYDLHKLGIIDQIHVEKMLTGVGQMVRSVEEGRPSDSPRQINQNQLGREDQSSNVYGDEKDPIPLFAGEV